MSKGFAFKKFVVNDDRCEMKVGTDSVLLGAWVKLDEASRALDIGTGCGLIALMMAQRNSTLRIDAVEILTADAQQASDNFALSPWDARIKVFNQSIQEFFSDSKYDVIISNPPFFVNSALPPDRQRAGVRHALTLSHDQLLAAVSRLLAPHGNFAVILPSTGYKEFVAKAGLKGLTPRRMLTFHTRPGKPAERHLAEFVFGAAKSVEERLSLYDAPFKEGTKDKWSDGYKTLVGDFYL